MAKAKRHVLEQRQRSRKLKGPKCSECNQPKELVPVWRDPPELTGINGPEEPVRICWPCWHAQVLKHGELNRRDQAKRQEAVALARATARAQGEPVPRELARIKRQGPPRQLFPGERILAVLLRWIKEGKTKGAMRAELTKLFTGRGKEAKWTERRVNKLLGKRQVRAAFKARREEKRGH